MIGFGYNQTDEAECQGSNMRRVLIIILLAYCIGGWVVLPYAIEHYGPKWIARQTGATLSLESVRFNPLTCTLSLKEVALDDPKGEPLLRFASLRVNMGAWAAVLGTVHIEELGIERPELYLSRNTAGDLNVAFLDANETSASKPEDASPLHVKVDRLLIEGGFISLRDASGAKPFALQIAPLYLNVEHFDTRTREGTIRLRAQTHDGGMATLKAGLSKGVGYRLEGELTYDSGRLFTGWQYLQDALALEIADGALHGRGTFSLDSGDPHATRLYNAALRLEHLRIKPKNAPHDLMRLEALNVEGIEVAPSQRRLQAQRVALVSPVLYAKRLEDGSVDWNAYLGTSKTKEAEVSEAPWTLSVAEIEVQAGLARLVDESVTPKAAINIDAFGLHVRDYQSNPAHKIGYEVTMKLNETGVFGSSGTFSLSPFALLGAVHIEGLDLKALDPYVTSALALTLARGYLRLDANVTTDGTSSRMEGRASLHDLVLNTALDDQLLLAFDTFSAAPFVLANDHVQIETLDLHALYANVHIDENKTLNYTKLRRSSASPAASPPFVVDIARFSLRDAAVDFADDSLPLHFRSHINELGGVVYGISSHPSAQTHLDMSGVVDRYGMMKLSGALAPFAPRSFADVALTFRNIALANMSPYSAGFAGRVIDEGKLDLDLRYHIVASQMTGENRIVIKKIKLGDTIGEAAPLPLGLAVALLEDRDGVIDIDLPVEGDMDNPRFRYGAVVYGAIKNLIVKAASAPFAVLGSLLGVESDTLRQVVFAPGRALLLPPEREKLDQLAHALSSRPKLTLGISGAYVLPDDATALRQIIFEAQYAKALEGSKGADPLEALYVEALGVEALTALRTAHMQSADAAAREQTLRETMRQTLIGLQEVGIEELESIAHARSRCVREYLIQECAIPAAQTLLELNSIGEMEGGDAVGSILSVRSQE